MKYKIIDTYAEIIKTKKKNFLYVTINIEPYSKSNNLYYGNRNAYVPKRFKENDKTVQGVVKEYIELNSKSKLSGPLVMQIDGFYSTKKVVDAPNLSKSICDALNDIAYYDDRQIILCTTTKSYDKLNPRIEIFIMSLDTEHDMVNMKPLLGIKDEPKPKKVRKVHTGPRKVKSGTKQRIKKQAKK